MNVSFFIARRYLISKKSTNAINIISLISVCGIFIGTAALIIVLSVFNGFQGIAVSMYNSFSPELKIEARLGKTFDPDTAGRIRIEKLPGVKLLVSSLEEKASLVYNGRSTIVMLRGLSPGFEKSHALDTMMIDGKLRLEEGPVDLCLLGAGVQYRLSVQTKSMEPITVYSPMRHSTGLLPGQIPQLSQLNLYPEGVFSIQQDYDDEYVLTSIRFMRKLLNEPVRVSSIDLYLDKGADLEAVKAKIKSVTGSAYLVRDRFEQNELLFKVLNSEKWAVFLILSFILMIAVFNVMGSLTMLVIEKEKDISILSGMGASMQLIRNIFLTEGLLISLSGALGGLGVGLVVCLLQQHFGFVSIGTGKTFVVDAYPVVLKWHDFLNVFITVFSISFIASWLAALQSVRSLKQFAGMKE